MIKLNSSDISHYKDKGWVLLNCGLSAEQIQKYAEHVKLIIKKAKINNYKFGRIYFDYLFDYNLAAVEAPLNRSICGSDVINFFSELEIGSAINSLMGWKNSVCSLIRLFCMGQYNYSGHWHQDNVISGKTVQVSIILNDEKFFKIVKKNSKKNKLNEEITNNISQNFTKFKLPVTLNNKYYDVIDAKKGDVILFEPYLLHKGSYNNSRLQFHMRFEEKNLDENKTFFHHNSLDFDLIKDYDFNISEENIASKIPIVKRELIHSRLRKTINYYLPIDNFYHYFKQKNIYKSFNYELFSNTAYQKRESK